MDKKLFITGKLAYNSLEKVVERMNPDFEYKIIKLDITVAALMDTEFILKHSSRIEAEITGGASHPQIILPGRCQLQLPRLRQKFAEASVVKGPTELLKLPQYLGYETPTLDLSEVERDARIIAEITEAPFLKPDEIEKRAFYYQEQGADIIDIGTRPGADFPHLEEAVRILKSRGFEVSIDSLKTEDIKRAAAAGIDYVLSLNSSNLARIEPGEYLPVIIPDKGRGLSSLKKNVKMAEAAGFTNLIVDPILDPINFGFRDSLSRYLRLKEIFPAKEVLIGIGNLIELTDADSTGINSIISGFIEELELDYVLTTEASDKTKYSVRELDLALTLMSYSSQQKILPNNLTEDLITIKDNDISHYQKHEIQEMAAGVTDSNYRIMIDGDNIYVFNGEQFISGTDVDEIFDRLQVEETDHAFYLGKELYKARTALTLNKEYQQEQPLAWGYLNKMVGGQN